MNAVLKILVLTVVWLMSTAALASQTVPVNATFGLQWTPVNWNPASETNPEVRITSTYGAAGLPNGEIIGNYSYTGLNPAAGTIDGFFVLYFSYQDAVVLQLSDGAASFDPLTGTASFTGPMNVINGWGRFAGATGTLTITSNILFGPFVGTYEIKGLIRTARSK